MVSVSDLLLSSFQSASQNNRFVAMAFDSSTRNRLAGFVKDARDLVTREFTQKFKELYGISENGQITPLEKLLHLDEMGRATAVLLRERIEYLACSQPHEKKGLAEAVARLVREQAFTVVNRLAAIRMAEKRGLIPLSVGKGYQSDGFRMYDMVAGKGLGEVYQRYRRYLFCLFDELALEIGILFQRHSPQGLLFPREKALLDLIELLNASDLDSLWVEDETIGWIYQYYNDPLERKKMRDESSAPRNSRELAVRNQFFTPRYVVEFLTDNTLGRIWYEMTQGNTSLKEQCRYLVRRPNEIFLKPGETAPEQPKQDNVSQEDLLKQPVQIPHRPLKDPRTILMLDPACGSMHFGLYAFDLLEVIYDEAWTLEEKLGADALGRPPGMKSLHETYTGKNAFLKDVPRQIIENNLHGIDIDPRCAQIAGLSLWLRAQKAWQRLGLKPAERPAIKRSNIVCAEPMPGDKELLRQFVDNEFPAAERAVCLRLLEAIFDKMQLAGEAGSLLKIEEEIRSAIEDAKKKWKAGPKMEQSQLFGGEKLKQQDIPLDYSGLTESEFWDQLEEKIYAALRDYAEQAESGGGFQRRLFAEDAARGFAFIDVCRKRYDVALMNPPFGDASESAAPLLAATYVHWCDNILCAFLIMGCDRLCKTGYMAAIFDRTAIVKSSYEEFRQGLLVADDKLIAFADLGWEVLDANVEVCSVVLGKEAAATGAFFDVRGAKSPDKETSLLDLVECGDGKYLQGSRFGAFPNAVIGYDFPEFLIEAFSEKRRLSSSGFVAYTGHQLGKDRHFRLWWEICLYRKPAFWSRVFKGGGWNFALCAMRDVLIAEADIVELPSNSSTNLRNVIQHGRPGLCFGERAEFMCAYLLPPKVFFTLEGPAIPCENHQMQLALFAVLNSTLGRFSLNKICGQHKTSGYVNLFPFRVFDPSELEGNFSQALSAQLLARSYDETQAWFTTWPCLGSLLDQIRSVTHANTDAARTARDFMTLADEKVLGIYAVDSRECSLLGISREASMHAYSPIDDLDDRSVPGFCVNSSVSFLLGTAFGRWDIRYATGERQPPELPDPFAPLPVCPPGMLQNAEGLPAKPKDVPAAYPVRIPWDGILVDDPNHPLDIERRVREVIEIIWSGKEGGPTAEAIEQEACEILGVRTLRDYFRKPAGFFADHLKRYSKSRRQAPIYWPLSTASGSYTLWIYYHRLTDQTLHSAIADFLDPKIKATGKAIDGARSKKRGAEVSELSDLLDELNQFREEIERVIKLPWKPNLNDGVLITACPLWRLFRHGKWQKDLKACWEALSEGEYDWAHLAYSIWPDRVRDKCKADRSLAIAHNLEELCKPQDSPKKPKKIKK